MWWREAHLFPIDQDADEIPSTQLLSLKRFSKKDLGCPLKISLLPPAIETSFLGDRSSNMELKIPVHNEAIVLSIAGPNIQPLHVSWFLP